MIFEYCHRNSLPERFRLSRTVFGVSGYHDHNFDKRKNKTRIKKKIERNHYNYKCSTFIFFDTIKELQTKLLVLDQGKNLSMGANSYQNCTYERGVVTPIQPILHVQSYRMENPENRRKADITIHDISVL